MKANLDEIFFAGTEKVGQSFDLETHLVIFDRYEFASQFCEGKRVLEVGCGSGMGLEYLSNHSKSFDAIEYSEQNVELLEGKGIGSARVIQGDAHDTIFKGHSFDLIIALAMIYYLELPRFLKEAKRLLDREGKIFFCTSNKDVPGFCEALGTTRYYSIPELYSELSQIGFEAEFYGSFPKAGGSLVTRRLKASLKNAIKALFEMSGWGKLFWGHLRSKSLGKSYPLPPKITAENIRAGERIRLDHNKPDFTHRVIYVVATEKAI